MIIGRAAPWHGHLTGDVGCQLVPESRQFLFRLVENVSVAITAIRLFSHAPGNGHLDAW